MILRPFRWPEAVWACAGALALVLPGLLPAAVAWEGMARGTDVYLFLLGMMLAAELARDQGLFDWLAAHAARAARGSASRLFALVYAVGTLVTVFLSNDATAVVLTPAVAAAARAAGAAKPLPFLLACAFVANAASFVLPISNPANLVVHGDAMPTLGEWLPRYALPSLAAILATFLALRWTQRDALRAALPAVMPVPALSRGGAWAAVGLAAMAATILVASALGRQLGLPTLLAGLGATAVVLLVSRRGPLPLLRGISWGVLPLVAGLFVLVEAMNRTGVTGALAAALEQAARGSDRRAAWLAGVAVAVGSNLVNNLPAGLLAGNTLRASAVPELVRDAVLIGVDLGPNLSVTGSLATILWLTALRREGIAMGAARFLRLGLVMMPPALLLAVGALFLAR